MWLMMWILLGRPVTCTTDADCPKVLPYCAETVTGVGYCNADPRTLEL